MAAGETQEVRVQLPGQDIICLHDLQKFVPILGVVMDLHICIYYLTMELIVSDTHCIWNQFEVRCMYVNVGFKVTIYVLLTIHVKVDIKEI